MRNLKHAIHGDAFWKMRIESRKTPCFCLLSGVTEVDLEDLPSSNVKQNLQTIPVPPIQFGGIQRKPMLKVGFASSNSSSFPQKMFALKIPGKSLKTTTYRYNV